MRDSVLIYNFKVMKVHLIIMLFLTATAAAQTEKATISVRGNCNMCKARIEKAAIKTKGVKYAVWQTDTETLKLIYNSNKTTVSKVSANIAAVGHEANGVAVVDSVYAALPMCCQYADGNPHRKEDL